MEPIVYINRQTGLQEVETVYGEAAIRLLYGNSFFGRLFGKPLMYLLSGIPAFSWLYGLMQRLSITKRKIAPFIRKFQIDASEFLEPVENFQSFNDFFIRKLKTSARPIARGERLAVIPADGRYRFYPSIEQSEGFLVKGEKFDLAQLLQDRHLAETYAGGAMVIARLCPSDYHRYHFPCGGIPAETKLINGWLYSVNPAALKQNIHIFTRNKRGLCEISTQHFGKVLFIEIGATAVGSMHQTYTPFQKVQKGEEKGYFSFGASSLILLFAPGTIALDPDLLAFPDQEIRCLMGQSMGSAH
jgi:phosphatidylserine decarboxylase